MNQRAENCVQYEARHEKSKHLIEQNQLLMQYRETDSELNEWQLW